MTENRPLIAISGGSRADLETLEATYQICKELAQRGAVVISGGLGGVMEAASKGARDGGGLSIGILPGSDSSAANPYVDIPIATGCGHLRNGIIIQSAQGVIVMPGAHGTLSEIAFARIHRKPLVFFGESWGEIIRNDPVADSPLHAAEKILELIAGST